MADFGNKTQTALTNFRNYIVAAWDTATDGNGTADSIVAYVAVASAHKVKCAIYEYVDYSSVYAGALIGVTEERNISIGGWETFIFPSPKPPIHNNTKYYLAAWSELGPDGSDIGYSVEAGYSIYKLLAYNGYPNPLTGESTYGNRFSIYCIYTPSVGGGLTLTLNPSPKGGMGRPAMLTGGASFGG